MPLIKYPCLLIISPVQAKPLINLKLRTNAEIAGNSEREGLIAMSYMNQISSLDVSEEF